MNEEPTPEAFGFHVLGPIVAEFCLRLWSLGSQISMRDDVALLFCARGGLRIQLAYERFLAASALPSPLHFAPVMISRVVAVRPALIRSLDEGLDGLVPSAAETLSYEFPRASLTEVAVATAGVAPSTANPEWLAPFTPRGFAALLRHREGDLVVDALSRQAALFAQHLNGVLGERRHAVLVDTGLHGTTQQLLADGLPDIDFSSLLIARSNYRRGLTPHFAKTFGLCVEADAYSPLHRRTAMLRYWHLIESLFEPALPSVRTFTSETDEPRSNLEVDDWQQRLRPTPGSAFAGVINYLDALPPGPAVRILTDADSAWEAFRRAIVWPDGDNGRALDAGIRSSDFGSELTFTARSWTGPIAALRGFSMWREGEIARSTSLLRWPLLVALETAYSARYVGRTTATVIRASDRRSRSWGAMPHRSVSAPS